MQIVMTQISKDMRHHGIWMKNKVTGYCPGYGKERVTAVVF